jgi:hypothetical protein
MSTADWYRPTGMGYTIYVPANDHTACKHPVTLNCDSIIVASLNGTWYWHARRGAHRVGPLHDGFKTQAAAKAAVERRFTR